MSGDLDYTNSSGNVFADIGVEEPEEALAKAELAIRIGSIIKHRGLTQAQAGSILGIDQPKVSKLLRGRLELFSLERLFRYLNALDRDVEIVIREKPTSRPEARIMVRAHPPPLRSRPQFGFHQLAWRWLITGRLSFRRRAHGKASSHRVG